MIKNACAIYMYVLDASMCTSIFDCHRDALMEQRDGQPKVQTITEALLKECRKEQIAYKLDALLYTGKVIETYSLDYFKEISDILYPMLAKVTFIIVKCACAIHLLNWSADRIIMLTCYL